MCNVPEAVVAQVIHREHQADAGITNNQTKKHDSQPVQPGHSEAGEEKQKGVVFVCMGAWERVRYLW